MERRSGLRKRAELSQTVGSSALAKKARGGSKAAPKALNDGTADDMMLDSTNAVNKPKQVKRSKKKMTPAEKKQLVDDANRAFVEAVEGGNMEEAHGLLLPGNVTGEGKRKAVRHLVESDRIDDLKTLIDQMGRTHAARLLNTLVQQPVDARADLNIVKGILEATSLSYVKTWSRLVIQSCWPELIAYVIGKDPSLVPLWQLSERFQRSMTFDGWKLLLSSGLTATMLELAKGLEYLANSGSERAFVDLVYMTSGPLNHTSWLVHALACDDVSIIKYLVERGAPMSGLSDWADAIQRALNEEKVDHLEALLECGASLEPFQYALQVSCMRGNTITRDYLLAKGFKVTAFELSDQLQSTDLKQVIWALDHGADPMAFDMVGWMFAVRQGMVDKLQLFIDRGLDVNADRGFAVFCACEQDNHALLGKLIEWGARPLAEALEFAKLRRRSGRVIEMLEEALLQRPTSSYKETSVKVPSPSSTSSFSLTTSNADLAHESQSSQTFVASGVFKMFAYSPAFQSTLRMLDSKSARSLRHTCRLFRDTIPFHRAVDKHHVVKQIERGVKMDYGDLIRKMHQTGDFYDFDLTIRFDWSGRLARCNDEYLYSIAVLMDDRDLLVYILDRHREILKSNGVDFFLLILIPMSSILTATETRAHLSGVSLVKNPYDTTMPPSMLSIYLNAFDDGPIQAIQSLEEFMGGSSLLLYMSVLNGAAIVAAERGHGEAVRALVRMRGELREESPAPVVSLRAVAGGVLSLFLNHDAS
ncbi:hypothetical protein HDU67_003782 [Dinochytrium kinnereticum]|nr:hypothetical protein HDU67_003782 [Dinochytrium kinnereticum]